MTINHRAEAEKHLANAARHLTEVPADMRIAEVAAAIGQGHATLARGEEQAATTADLKEALYSLRRRFNDTREAVAAHIAEGLASREKNRWKAAIDLSKALDEAHCNVDDLVDARLSDDGWDPRSAYKAVDSAVRSDDPWAPVPDITDQVPEPVRRVIAGQLAEALIDGRDGEIQNWARGITYELKRVGADLTDAIKTRITEMTLGADPTDPPF
ncbi:hypothetical protein STENM36S_06314 [Streptomyces tendae]